MTQRQILKEKLEFQCKLYEGYLIPRINALVSIYDNWQYIPKNFQAFFLHYSSDLRDLIILSLSKVYKNSKDDKNSLHKVFNIVESNGLDKHIINYEIVKEEFFEHFEEASNFINERNRRIAHADGNIVIKLENPEKLKELVYFAKITSLNIFREIYGEDYSFKELNSEQTSIKAIINILKNNFEEAQDLIYKNGMGASPKNYDNVSKGLKKQIGE